MPVELCPASGAPSDPSPMVIDFDISDTICFYEENNEEPLYTTAFSIGEEPIEKEHICLDSTRGAPCKLCFDYEVKVNFLLFLPPSARRFILRLLRNIRKLFRS